MHITYNKGFTVIELLIAIVVIGILVGLGAGVMSGSLAKGRDRQRVGDIDTIHNKLEEYYTNKGGYPSVLSSVPRLDPEALKDTNGNSITINTPASNYFAAASTTNPTASSASQYTYSPYPTGCGTSTPCAGYVLKSYIEAPDSETPSPYVRTGVNNN